MPVLPRLRSLKRDPYWQPRRYIAYDNRVAPTERTDCEGEQCGSCDRCIDLMEHYAEEKRNDF